MPDSRDLSALIPLEKCVLQPYFSNSIQLGDIIVWAMEQIGQAHLTISTFSTGEEFLRRLAKIKQSGLVLSCQMFCDLRAARKTAALYTFIRSVFDTVYLCENHSKVVLIANERAHVAIVTSQNQTRGDRFEAGVITTDNFTFDKLMRGFIAMSDKSISLDDLQQGIN